MTITLLCCYHCASFFSGGNAKACAQSKAVCYNAFISGKDPKARDDCNRRNGECAERFDSGEAKVAHSCFVKKGGG